MSFLEDIGGVLGGVGGFFVGGPIGAAVGFGLGSSAVGSLLGGGDAKGIAPPIAPPLPPDATDEQIRQAVLMQRRRLLLGQGQGSTFISGPTGDIGSFSTSASSAGGF